MIDMSLVEINGLGIEFWREGDWCPVVDGLSLRVDAGEVVALVGESGAGKSVTALAITRLLPEGSSRFASGRIRLEGNDVSEMSARALQQARGGVVSYVFQEPGAALNPVQRIGAQVMESLKLHCPDQANRRTVVELLRQVGIPAPEERMRQYPFQMSGGMLQRAMLAMALASRPKLLVADEPTTALDVTIQAQIVELLKQLKGRDGMSILLITHNLALVADLADRVAVMYAGEIVETGPVAEVLRSPLHPYSRALLDSVPVLGQAKRRLLTIPGNVPSPGSWPRGCRFHPRCNLAAPDCAGEHPELLPAQPGRSVRCPYGEDKTIVSDELTGG